MPIPPSIGLTAAIAATLAVALYALAGAIFITWFYSGLAVAAIVVPWAFVVPMLVQVGVFLVVAIGLMRRWRTAFAAALALHLFLLLGWGALLVSGSPVAFEWAALIPPALGVIGISGLSSARSLFWDLGDRAVL